MREILISLLYLLLNHYLKILYKKGYLVIGNPNEEVSFPTDLIKPRLPHTTFKTSNKKWYIQKRHGRKICYYAFFEDEMYDEAKLIIEFLKNENWDLKYSMKQTNLSGKDQFEFLLNKAKKELKYD